MKYKNLILIIIHQLKQLNHLQKKNNKDIKFNSILPVKKVKTNNKQINMKQIFKTNPSDFNKTKTNLIKKNKSKKEKRLKNNNKPKNAQKNKKVNFVKINQNK